MTTTPALWLALPAEKLVFDVGIDLLQHIETGTEGKLDAARSATSEKFLWLLG
jgi:hypothetical protein